MATILPVSERTVYSVTQLNGQIRQMLETLPLLWIEGEISNLSKPSSGHWYFTLKDAQSQVRCAMFRNRSGALRFIPKEGDKILVRAKVSLYEGRGDYQLIVEHMEPAGLGDLQRQFEVLKARLEAEGLFDSKTKQPLPLFPRRIGIITSPSGAAVHDLLQVLGRRFPAIPVLIFPVIVQGREAAAAIAQAIALANSRRLCDLLIVGRGGGSLEDLWAFNEEILVRAIHASEIPTISAVGHEVDFTLADFVADLRAPTPSAAAELAVPHQDEISQMFAGRLTQLQRALARRLDKAAHKLDALQARMQHPGQKLVMQQQKVDILEMRIFKAWQASNHKAHLHHSQLNERLQRQNPSHKIALRQQQWVQLQKRLPMAWQQHLQRLQQRLGAAAATLQNLSPLPTMQRGYLLALDEHSHLVRSSTQLYTGQRLTLKFHDGDSQVKVETIRLTPL